MHGVNFNMHYVIIGEGGSVSSCVDELRAAIASGQAANGEIVVLLPTEDEKKKLELPEDVEVLIGDPTNRETLAIVTSFAGKLYGARSHRKKRLNEAVKNALRDD